ncbi:MAG TPA: hypothetical protein VFQ06_13715, partial [Nitrospira sp.]|nr:hypothetical protein [Nitrospira sp.]
MPPLRLSSSPGEESIASQKARRPLCGSTGQLVGSCRIHGGARYEKNLNRKLAGLGLDPVPMTDEVVILRHDADRILQALSRLRAKEQEVLRLAEWEDLS